MTISRGIIYYFKSFYKRRYFAVCCKSSAKGVRWGIFHVAKISITGSQLASIPLAYNTLYGARSRVILNLKSPG